MSSERIRKLLKALNKELHATPDFDPETRRLLQELNDTIENRGDDEPSALERARELESEFAATHPTAARIARELADIIAKMGV